MVGSYFLIMMSAICEAIWNISLKKSSGLLDWKINLVGILFLAIGIVTFKKAIDVVPISIGLVMWSGIEVILTILLDIAIFGTHVDWKVWFFVLLCLTSISGMLYMTNK